MEEQVLTLKEQLSLMTCQVERIEEELEKKLRDKDKANKKL